jgi:[glutamine synthetase] adenylyltransferase / [glutamine synthetase]-adenylyl-L-tyrosine phosphorylase
VEEFSPSFESWASQTCHPARALSGILAWLRVTPNPRLYQDQLLAMPEISLALMNLLGASQAMVDLLIQNPEIPSILFEREDALGLPEPAQMMQIGLRTLQGSISYQHTLDRLRYLHQRKIFQIAIIDVNEWQPAPRVWRALSDLADVITKLTLDAAWDYFRRMKMLGEIECPVSVIAMGKHGGKEVNYSSDLDLIFVIDDTVSQDLHRETFRFCESLIRAFTDRMGRGALYRIDMRLRPYGNAGDIAYSMRAQEAYYRLYAEPWEVQALIRSRFVCGSDDVKKRWNEMRIQHCFTPHVSEFTIDATLEMRAKIDALANRDDFKRGRGGIRDVEFIVQTLQRIRGHNSEKIQEANTLVALEGLVEKGYIDADNGEILGRYYSWLRQLEHRCQLLHNTQTHQLPVDPEEIKVIAKQMKFPSGEALNNELSRVRNLISGVYGYFEKDTVNLGQVRKLNQFLGSHISDDELKFVLETNSGSLSRLQTVSESAPLLVRGFERSWALGEALLSGEIEEAVSSSSKVEKLVVERARIWSLWLLEAESEPWIKWTEAVEKALLRELENAPAELIVIGLGSFGNQEMSPGSDVDLLFLVTDYSAQQETEKWVTEWLARWEISRTEYANPVEIDLRLRADGKKGLTVRTVSSYVEYVHFEMDPWEFYMLGHARVIRGEFDLSSIYAKKIEESEYRSLREVKARITNELVRPEHLKIDVKLGEGALLDIEWIQRHYEMRSGVGGGAPLKNRLAQPVLVQAYSYFRSVRARGQLGQKGDLEPANEQSRQFRSQVTSMFRQLSL